VSLSVNIGILSESQKISRDHAALQIIESIRELDAIWTDYVTMEGIDRLKKTLKGHH
jgi:LPS sulfotransferase NodH